DRPPRGPGDRAVRHRRGRGQQRPRSPGALAAPEAEPGIDPHRARRRLHDPARPALKRPSLRSRLTLLNISLMFCVLVPVGVIGYQHETRAMENLLDGRLAQSGRTIVALIAHGAQLPLLVERTPD